MMKEHTLATSGHMMVAPDRCARQSTIDFDVEYCAFRWSPRQAAHNEDAKVVAAGTPQEASAASDDPQQQQEEEEEEETHHAKHSVRPTLWDENAAPKCFSCCKPFHLLRWRHHCRACGGVFCDECSSNKITIPRLKYKDQVRVCDVCWVREAELRYKKPSTYDSTKRTYSAGDVPTKPAVRSSLSQIAAARTTAPVLRRKTDLV